MAMERSATSSFRYSEFRQKLEKEEFSREQRASLKQRLGLLESFMEESQKTGTADVQAVKPKNQKTQRAMISKEKALNSSVWSFEPGSLTIVDLSCPFVDDSLACTLFSICLGLFLENRGDVGRVVVLDEAHRVRWPNTPIST